MITLIKLLIFWYINRDISYAVNSNFSKEYFNRTYVNNSNIV